MTLDDLITELLDRGHRLHYLRQCGTVWEAMILKPIEHSPSGFRNALGYGQSSSPHEALSLALETIESDPEFQSFEVSDITTPPAHLDIMKLVFEDKPAEISILKPRHL